MVHFIIITYNGKNKCISQCFQISDKTPENSVPYYRDSVSPFYCVLFTVARKWTQSGCQIQMMAIQ